MVFNTTSSIFANNTVTDVANGGQSNQCEAAAMTEPCNCGSGGAVVGGGAVFTTSIGASLVQFSGFYNNSVNNVACVAPMLGHRSALAAFLTPVGGPVELFRSATVALRISSIRVC